MTRGINIFMSKKDIKIVKKKNSFGSTIEYHYKDDKLVEKIDYSTSNPRVWKYDSDGNSIGLTVIEKKSNKKFWLGAIGTLLIISLLCSKCCSTNKSKTYKHIIQPNIEHTK